MIATVCDACETPSGFPARRTRACDVNARTLAADQLVCVWCIGEPAAMPNPATVEAATMPATIAGSPPSVGLGFGALAMGGRAHAVQRSY